MKRKCAAFVIASLFVFAMLGSARRPCPPASSQGQKLANRAIRYFILGRAPFD